MTRPVPIVTAVAHLGWVCYCSYILNQHIHWRMYVHWESRYLTEERFRRLVLGDVYPLLFSALWLALAIGLFTRHSIWRWAWATCLSFTLLSLCHAGLFAWIRVADAFRIGWSVRDWFHVGRMICAAVVLLLLLPPWRRFVRREDHAA
jgi:hypothetical protein